MLKHLHIKNKILTFALEDVNNDLLLLSHCLKANCEIRG